MQLHSKSYILTPLCDFLELSEILVELEFVYKNLFKTIGHRKTYNKLGWNNSKEASEHECDLYFTVFFYLLCTQLKSTSLHLENNLLSIRAFLLKSFLLC